MTDNLKDEYQVFFQAVSQYARDQYAIVFPGRSPLNISVETTHRGLLDSATQNYYQQLNQFSDVVGVSYYPLTNGAVENPGIVASETFSAWDEHKDEIALIDLPGCTICQRLELL